MPFGLKNAGATYQRLVNKIFAELIGTSMKVYVNDMLVKIKTAGDHLWNLSLMFGTLKKYSMRLRHLFQQIPGLHDQPTGHRS